MAFEEFILRVRACIGIGLATEFKIYQFIKQNKRVPNLNDFIQIMDGKYAIASDAYMRIFSKKTTELLQQTLAFSKYITILIRLIRQSCGKFIIRRSFCFIAATLSCSKEKR